MSVRYRTRPKETRCLTYLLRIDARHQQLKRVRTLRYGRWLAWRQLMLQQSRGEK